MGGDSGPFSDIFVARGVTYAFRLPANRSGKGWLSESTFAIF